MRMIFLLFVMGCGLGPAPAVDTRGASPWTDLGAATICFGDRAVDGPDAAVGGLCLSPLTPPTSACSADTDCASREACVCGRCTIPYCATSSDCSADRFCDFATNRCDQRCTAATDCALGEECINGACRGRCATSEECQHGEVCDRTRVCITDACADATGCFPGETCAVQREPFAIAEPAPSIEGGELVLYVELGGSIWRASATNASGTQFVLAAQPLRGGRAPSVVGNAQGPVGLVFEQSDGIYLATFDRAGGLSAPELLLANAHTPSALGDELVYYERDGSIGLYDLRIRSDRGIVLAPTDVQVGDPADPTTPFWSPVTRLASPHAIIAGPPAAPSIHLYFSALGTESPPATKFGAPEVIPPNYSIGKAIAALEAPELLAPWPYGPIVDTVVVFLEHLDEFAPATVALPDGRTLLYYVGSELSRISVLSSTR